MKIVYELASHPELGASA